MNLVSLCGLHNLPWNSTFMCVTSDTLTALPGKSLRETSDERNDRIQSRSSFHVCQRRHETSRKMVSFGPVLGSGCCMQPCLKFQQLKFRQESNIARHISIENSMDVPAIRSPTVQNLLLSSTSVLLDLTEAMHLPSAACSYRMLHLIFQL